MPSVRPDVAAPVNPDPAMITCLPIVPEAGLNDVSELAMAHHAHSHIIMFHGGSHLTLASHPNAVTEALASAMCSLH